MEPRRPRYCAPDDELHMLLAGLLAIDPDHRLSAQQALDQCPYLARLPAT